MYCEEIGGKLANATPAGKIKAGGVNYTISIDRNNHQHSF